MPHMDFLQGPRCSDLIPATETQLCWDCLSSPVERRSQHHAHHGPDAYLPSHPTFCRPWSGRETQGRDWAAQAMLACSSLHHHTSTLSGADRIEPDRCCIFGRSWAVAHCTWGRTAHSPGPVSGQIANLARCWTASRGASCTSSHHHTSASLSGASWQVCPSLGGHDHEKRQKTGSCAVSGQWDSCPSHAQERYWLTSPAVLASYLQALEWQDQPLHYRKLLVNWTM